MSNDLVAAQEPEQQQNNLVMNLFAAATREDVDAAKLLILEGVYTRQVERDQRQAFVRAMVEFAKEVPVVLKNRVNAHTKNKYADFKSIADAVKPVLSKHGLMTHFTVTSDQQTGMITVTCNLTHRDGHSETSRQSGMPDEGSGRSRIQAVGSATTYLKKYALLDILAISTGDEDDVDQDSQRKAEAGVPTMTDGQFKSLEVRCQAFRTADEMRMLYADIVVFKALQNKEKIDRLSAIYAARKKELSL